MSEKTVITEVIESFPFDEGTKARMQGKSIHDNPYKSPNTPKTDDVKSEAWLWGFQQGLKK